MKLTNHELNKFADLQKSFVGGARTTKIGVNEIEKIGNILMTEYVKQGKKFNTAVVADIITKNKIADYSKCGNPEQALKTASRKVLQELGVIPAPKKAEKKTTATSDKNSNE